MKNIRHVSADAERSEAERAARREWQHRSRACGHRWCIYHTLNLRIYMLCAKREVWSSWLKDWTSRESAERAAKVNKDTRRARDKQKGST